LSVLCGNETGTIKEKDEFRSSASKVKFMNWDEKNNPKKKEKFFERSRDISVGMEMETLLIKFMDHRMRRLNSRTLMEC